MAEFKLLMLSQQHAEHMAKRYLDDRVQSTDFKGKDAWAFRTARLLTKGKAVR